MRGTEKRAFSLIMATASAGTRPSSALASVAAIYTSSQLWNLASSLQSRPISGKV
jgi:hypothetical protein